jgi:uncharacterized protein
MNETILNRASDFTMIFLGLAMSAIPFIVIGVTISCLIAKYISADWVRKHRSKNLVLSHVQAMFIGLFLPVCQCGNVPLAKRLSIVGFRPSEVITFMLSAPIFNPLVLMTTLVAFNLDSNVAIIRVLGGGLIALFVGLIFSLHPQPADLLVSIEDDKFVQPKKDFSFQASLTTPKPNLTEQFHDGSFVDNWRDEFFNVFRMLLLGCLIAASFQMLIPRSFFATFASSPTLSILALMTLAFVVSICSSVDAFFALAFVGTFNLGSILAFLIFGPIIDINSLMMLRSVLRTRTLVSMTVLVALMSLIVGLCVNYFYRINYF